MSDPTEFLAALAGFLLARLDEDEQRAQGDVEYSGLPAIVEYGRHMLVDVEAKRRIIAEHEIEIDGVDEGEVGPASATMPAHSPRFGCRTCHVDDRHIYDGGYCITLRALALPYASHEDYRPEWAP